MLQREHQQRESVVLPAFPKIASQYTRPLQGPRCARKLLPHTVQLLRCYRLYDVGYLRYVRLCHPYAELIVREHVIIRRGDVILDDDGDAATLRGQVHPPAPAASSRRDAEGGRRVVLLVELTRVLHHVDALLLAARHGFGDGSAVGVRWLVHPGPGEEQQPSPRFILLRHRTLASEGHVAAAQTHVEFDPSRAHGRLPPVRVERAQAKVRVNRRYQHILRRVKTRSPSEVEVVGDCQPPMRQHDGVRDHLVDPAPLLPERLVVWVVFLFGILFGEPLARTPVAREHHDRVPPLVLLTPLPRVVDVLDRLVEEIRHLRPPIDVIEPPPERGSRGDGQEEQVRVLRVGHPVVGGEQALVDHLLQGPVGEPQIHVAVELGGQGIDVDARRRPDAPFPLVVNQTRLSVEVQVRGAVRGEEARIAFAKSRVAPPPVVALVEAVTRALPARRLQAVLARFPLRAPRAVASSQLLVASADVVALLRAVAGQRGRRA